MAGEVPFRIMVRRGATEDALIRVADSRDANAISDLLLQAFTEYQALYTEDAFHATVPASDLVMARMNEGPVYVACIDGAPVATASVVITSGECYIRGMAVTPAARGRQIGRKLLERIEEFARDQGIVRLYLSTTPFLHHAISLYERCGFDRTADGPHELYGTPLFTMEKLLGPQL